MMLAKDDYIITAYAESATGSGWANHPVWIIVQSRDGKIRKECLQPDEQSIGMQYLYATSRVAHLSMTREAELLVGGKRRRIGKPRAT